jgi:hypothetical protein
VSVGLCKLAEMEPRCFDIGRMSLFRRFKSSDAAMFSVHSDLGDPAITSAFSSLNGDAFKSRLIHRVVHVLHVLRVSAGAQIFTAIIQTVTILMVDFLSLQKKRVHQLSALLTSIPHIARGVPLSALIGLCVPAKWQHPRRILNVDDRPLTPGQRNCDCGEFHRGSTLPQSAVEMVAA